MILGVIPGAYRLALNHGLVCWAIGSHDPSWRHGVAVGLHKPACTRCHTSDGIVTEEALLAMRRLAEQDEALSQ